ncbi:Clp protease N-terminal domain-containing protein [Nonomuraea sp. NPDC050328]|uniref:Clp protease N-terminal domain-containing protein n=1 Tax=Nonomuraea sp. NPDC050328 TaxID=3364361 RepID=UPI00378EC0F5
MLDRFTPEARRAFVRAGILAHDARPEGGRFGTDALLLALAEQRPFAGPVAAFTLTPDAVPLAATPGRDLLATLGIDLDEVRRRTRHGVDDPARWHLDRLLLRLTLRGPLGDLPLTLHLRKVVEVAAWKPGPITGERLLWGLLADARNGAARTLRTAGVDLAALVAQAGVPVRRAA